MSTVPPPAPFSAAASRTVGWLPDVVPPEAQGRLADDVELAAAVLGRRPATGELVADFLIEAERARAGEVR